MLTEQEIEEKAEELTHHQCGSDDSTVEATMYYMGCIAGYKKALKDIENQKAEEWKITPEIIGNAIVEPEDVIDKEKTFQYKHYNNWTEPEEDRRISGESC